MSSWEIEEDDWPHPGTTSDILIVDDDASIRTMLAFVFDDAGYTVVEAADGQEALDALAADAPALMVLDLMMPGIDGVEVLRRRQRELLAPNTRVLILTAKLDT